MRNFIFGVISAFIILIGILAYRQNIFQPESLPYDDEQAGLDEQVVINFSHVVAENTPKGLAATRFAELVNKKSGGKVIVYIHPNGVLYNDSNELEALQNGNVQMIAPSISNMTNKLPSWQLFDLPFLFKDDEQVAAALTGQLSESLLEELDSLHIKGLTFWSSGFKQIAANTPIVNIEDFEGLRIRTMPSNMLKQQYEIMHAIPITTPFTDIYEELDSMQIAAQENTISNLFSKGYHKTHANITLSNHGILSYAVMINEGFWEELDTETQQIITDSLAEMSEWQHELAIELNEENLHKLENNKEVSLYTMNEEETLKWQQAVRPIYDVYAQRYKKYMKLLLNDLEVQNNK
ncbi:DctP family TRAP transporter solute-binding subunit [Solibacillus sp. CAU 1738]|uniref:DctP family TRAP transporter solute-binding subunit n=1 Tax=Solibacillus sp. CAU 1738 TaxID=3140363 RepID=UPI003260ED62